MEIRGEVSAPQVQQLLPDQLLYLLDIKAQLDPTYLLYKDAAALIRQQRKDIAHLSELCKDQSSLIREYQQKEGARHAK